DIKPFHFHDLEGPNARARNRKLLRARVIHEGHVVHAIPLTVAGLVMPRNGFAIEVSRAFDERGSEPVRKLLRTLAEEGDAFEITVTDYRDPAVKLDLTIPIERQDVAWLIAASKP